MKLPENLEVEKKLISALMLGRSDAADVISHAGERLKPEEFYREEHRCIFRAIETALGLNIALNAVRQVPVGIFSLEMSAGQLG